MTKQNRFTHISVNRPLYRLLLSLVLLLAGFATSVPADAARVKPKARPTGFEVQFKVLSAETNQPIPGAVISIMAEDGEPKPLQTITVDQQGNATVSLLKGNYRYMVSSNGMGSSLNYLYLSEQPRQEFQIWLNKGAALNGRLVDGEGRPMKDIKIGLDQYFSATTDHDGRFSFEDLDSRGYGLDLKQADWVLEKSHYPQMVAGETTSMGDLTVRRSAVVELGIRLQQNRYLTSGNGLSVNISGQNIWRYGKLDNKGRLKFGQLPPGSYTISSSDERLQQTEQQVTLVEGQRQQVLLDAVPRPPSLELEFYGDTLLTDKPVNLWAYGLWTRQARATLYHVPPELVLQNRFDTNKPELINTAGLTAVKNFNIRLQPLPSTHRNRSKFTLPALPAGVYLLHLNGADSTATARAAFIVTDLALVAKSSPERTFIQAVQIRTGKPLENVGLYGDDPTKPAVITGKDGLADWDIQQYGSRLVGRQWDSLARLMLSARDWDTKPAEFKGYLYTERTIYRPGQTVFYKGILRHVAGEGYQLPEQRQIELKISDQHDKTVHSEVLTSSNLGSFHGSFQLPDQPLLGYYSITATSGDDSWQTSFNVQEYRKPEFELKLDAGANRFVLPGEQARIKLSANYYFGSPVAKGKLIWRVYSQPWYRDEAVGGSFGSEYSHFGGYNEFLGQGEATLDEQGQTEITITAGQVEQPLHYVVEVDVTDLASQQVSGSSGFTVVPSQYDISIKGDQYLYQPDHPASFTVQVSDWQADDKFGQPDQAVNLLVELQQLDKKSKTYGWSRIATLNGRTDAGGRAGFSYSFPEPGYWRVRAETFDTAGRRSFADNHAWVWQQGRGWEGSYRELEAEFDKKSYQVGETARLIVRTPAQGGSLMLALEGRDVADSRVIPVETAMQVLEIPVTAQLAPNIHVSLSMISNGRFYHQQGLLKVEQQPGKLELELEPEQEVYAPGDTALIRITTKAEGRPVPAELSLAVVDEAIFALAPETREEIYIFFHGRRDHLVRTIYSFPRLYLGGAAKDRVAAMSLDEGLEGVKVRKDFRDTAGWIPVLASGADGQVTAQVQLPDNLTRWRATAMGHTSNSYFGSGQTSFISRLPFMARLAPPRFMVVGDELMIPSILNDASDQEQQVKGRFETTGLTLLSAPEYSGNLPAGGSLRQEMTVKAEQAGAATIKHSAFGDNGRDSLELSLPVLPKALQREQSAAIALQTGQALHTLTLPETALADSGNIIVNFSSNLADNLIPALERLIDFPYGCTEQTVARFVPAAYALHLLQNQGFSLPAGLQEKLPLVVNKSLKQLEDLQHDDGGWGWWKNDNTSPQLTALVMQGLALADKAGLELNQAVLQNGKSALEQMLQSTTIKPDQAALLYRAFTAHGGSNTLIKQKLLTAQAELSPVARIAFAEALANQGRQEQALDLLANLFSQLQHDNEAAWLAMDDGNRFLGNSSTEVTADLLAATARISPRQPLADKLARYLSRHQQGGWWRSTASSAASVIALSEYVAARQLNQASYTARLLLNDKPVQQYQVEQGRLVKGESRLVLPASNGENRIRLEKEGQHGLAWLGVNLHYLVPVEQTESSQDLTISRKIYRISSVNDNGRWRHEYHPLQPGETVEPGQDLEVRLTVRSRADQEYLVLEDYLPAGSELRRTNTDLRYADEARYIGWYSHHESRDTMQAWFINRLPAGQHQFSYVIHPELKGSVTALPTAIWPMYRPELRSEAELLQLEVR